MSITIPLGGTIDGTGPGGLNACEHGSTPNPCCSPFLGSGSPNTTLKGHLFLYNLKISLQEERNIILNAMQSQHTCRARSADLFDQVDTKERY